MTVPYERPTLHPVRDAKEFRRRLALKSKVESREYPYQNNEGAVIAFGFERYANAEMRAGFDAIEQRERERQEVENRRIDWMLDHPGEWLE